MNTAEVLSELQAMGLTIEQVTRIFQMFATVTNRHGNVTCRHVMSDAERSKKYRETQKIKKLAVTENVTNVTNGGSGGLSVSSLESLEKLKKVKTQDARAKEEDSPEKVFEVLWGYYPKREGSNPKKTAKMKFVRMMKAGVDPQEVIDGLERMLAQLAHDGTEPRFIPMMSTWLNQERWRDDQESGSELRQTERRANGSHS